MQVEPIHILTLADDRYAMPLAVMGRSLLDNYRGARPIQLTIIDGGFSPESRQRVERSWADSTSAFHAEWVQPHYGEAARLPVYGRVPPITYARLFLDVYCPHSPRAVLLDSDTLVLADIAALNDTPLDGHVLAAAIDPFIPTMDAVDGLPSSARAHLHPNDPYFNAGVFLADVVEWRRERVGEQCLHYIAAHAAELRQYDQDALNAVLAGRWKMLPREWNTQPRTPNALGLALPKEPAIVHFSGRLKPWVYDGGTVVDRLFFHYLDRTEWRGLRPPATLEARLLRLYDSPPRRLLHLLECRLLALQRSITLALRRR